METLSQNDKDKFNELEHFSSEFLSDYLSDVSLMTYINKSEDDKKKFNINFLKDLETEHKINITKEEEEDLIKKLDETMRFEYLKRMFKQSFPDKKISFSFPN